MDSLNISIKTYNPVYQEIYFKIINPLIDFCGISGNIWILFTLIFGSVKISKTTKFYYLLIGVSDLLNVANHFFWADICVGLLLWKIPNLYYSFVVSSDGACIFLNLWYYLTDIVSDYSLVALSIERFIAVCLPFMAKSILTKKFRFFLLFVLLVPFMILFSILIPLSARVIPYAREDVTYACHFDYGSIFGKIFNFSMPIIVLGLHTVIDLIVSLILFFKLYLSKRNPDLNSKSQKGTKDLTATIVLIMLCTCTMVIYGITFLLYIATAIFEYFLEVPEEFSYHIYAFMHIFLALTALPHSVNIFIYITVIPSFRYYAFCKMSKHRGGPITTASSCKDS